METIRGTVVRQDFEGGFWGIIGEDGTKYRPLGALPEAVQRDGCRVEADIERADVISFAMWGTSVHVRRIQPR